MSVDPKFRRPKHPERICWGCDKLCPVSDLACGNGTVRTPHPVELFGEDWLEARTESESASEAADRDDVARATSAR